jgi:dihydropteroate synthase
MGIINVTPDSFYDGGFVKNESELLKHAEKMVKDGAAILDVGGMSSRPGSEPVSEEEELRRVLPAIEILHRNFPQTIISIDTWRSKVAREAVVCGARRCK